MAKTNERKVRVQPEGKLLVDDLWLDAGEHALEEIARICLRKVGHKPSLEDFRQLLRSMLCGDLNDYFADAAEVKVTDVIFKAKQKPSVQRYKDGDAFAIPLGDGRYAFGRLLRFDRTVGSLIEVFRATSTRKTFRPSIVASGRLFHPVMVSDPECLKNSRWTVVASDDSYQFLKADEELEFTALRPPHWVAEKTFKKGAPARRISVNERRRMEANGQSDALRGPEYVEDRIREALKRGPR